MTIHNILKQYFGYDSFREGQERLIDEILAGGDVLGIMPTGAGKSLCFQVPALAMEGLTLIVSPLISLMKDQVNALTQAGISAAFINSSLSERQIQKALTNAANGAYKLIYIAPERLLSSDFIYFCRSVRISMLTVDEAHCISQWGQDFRPSYSAIPEFIKQLNSRPVISAFTATATPIVRDDIINKLALDKPTVLVAGFDRPNLRFDIKKPKDKFAALMSFLENKKNMSGIVYCTTRNAVEEVCDRLIENGYSASGYHAGLPDYTRSTNQDDFLHDRVNVMVATNAFGMGIDKSNVSFVVHYNMPKDIEAYYQEAGRAGRDGGDADCLLLYSGQDINTNMFLIENGVSGEHASPEKEREIKERAIKRLHEMSLYCKTSECLRSYILKYFGEAPQGYCGNCMNCDADFEEADITTDAQKIISCVARMKERFGMNMIIDVLRGKRNARVLTFGLDKLSTFGISNKTAEELGEIMNHMILEGYISKTVSKFPLIRLGPRAGEVLQQGSTILMKTALKQADEDGSYKYSKNKKPMASVNNDLFAALKELRLKIAKEQAVPAFVVFPDSSLIDMCMKLPINEDEFLEISGVGKMKAERYGRGFLEVIKGFAGNGAGGFESASRKQQNNPFKDFNACDIETSEDAVTVSTIADRINCVLLESGYDKISGKRINDWLVSTNLMSIAQLNGKNFKILTNSGIELGMVNENRTIRGENVTVNLFSRSAQKYIADNTLNIVKFKQK